MGKHTLQQQIDHRYNSIMRIGESRHADKAAMIRGIHEAGGKYDPTRDALEGIYSMQTRKTYQKAAERFAAWCIREKGAGNRASLKKLERYAVEYLTKRAAAGFSSYTVRTERAALGKLFGHNIDVEIKQTAVKRSRGSAKRDAHFSEANNAALVAVCRGTGGRRDDITRLTPAAFRTDKEGRLFVRFEGSKGGRDRVAFVLPQYRDAVEAAVQSAKDRGGIHAPLFEKVHGAADIHSYRRDYARGIYQAARCSQGLRMAIIRANGKLAKGGPASGTYAPRDGSGVEYDRAALQSVSLCLGHSRIDTAISHYLT